MLVSYFEVLALKVVVGRRAELASMPTTSRRSVQLSALFKLTLRQRLLVVQLALGCWRGVGFGLFCFRVGRTG